MEHEPAMHAKRQQAEQIAQSPLGALVDQARRVRRTIRAWAGSEIATGEVLRVRSERLGSVYGGWDVVPEGLGASSVVYGAGVGDDISWDLGMIRRFGCSVHAFDPTPRCQRWLATQSTPERFVFHPVGLADYDGNASFEMRSEDPKWSSYSIGGKTGDGSGRAVEKVDCVVKRVSTLMREMGHQRIDVLKMDIEGAEYGVIDDLMRSGVRPAQLLIEFHYWGDAAALARTKKTIADLRGAGYRLFARSAAGAEFSFLHRP